MEKISIVTPVYNASKFIGETYASLLHQSLSDWKWTVVDDGSTDGSGDILDAIAKDDRRVKVIHQSNSGSAKYPRDRAVYESDGDLILMLDADDTIDRDYLLMMLQRMDDTNADIVYPLMSFEKEGRCLKTLPQADIEIEKVYRGRDVVRLTIPDWKIGCNGGLYRRSAWTSMSYPTKNERIYMNSDEVDERLYLIGATKVAFCIDAVYHYRQTNTSITSSFNSKRFDIIHTNQQICEIMKREFGESSQEYLLAGRKAITEWQSCFSLFLSNHDMFQHESKRIMDDFRHTYLSLPEISLSGLRDRSKLFALKSFSLTKFIFFLRYNPALIIKKHY